MHALCQVGDFHLFLHCLHQSGGNVAVISDLARIAAMMQCYQRSSESPREYSTKDLQVHFWILLDLFPYHAFVSVGELPSSTSVSGPLVVQAPSRWDRKLPWPCGFSRLGTISIPRKQTRATLPSALMVSISLYLCVLHLRRQDSRAEYDRSPYCAMVESF